MNNKYVILTKKELFNKMKDSNFFELFKTQPKKATLLFNDLWDSMTPTPDSLNKKILFEGNYLRWQYEVEGEIK